MDKPFRPAPLELLARWIFGALHAGRPVLGLPIAGFGRPNPRMATVLHGKSLAAPIGVAAGPHTQLAQNIVAAWLSGARFIELKTVQIQDRIDVSRPCIDSADETYNCEWSQELTLDESFDEYLKAWVLLHALAHKLGLMEPGAAFAMSVGYDLQGITSEKVKRFVARMRDASDALPSAVDAVACSYPPIRDLAIPREISNHITLSTMHGCPPREIEAIARHFLVELGVHTWVKMNPTLLGPERLRGILNGTFGRSITVPEEAFEHDPTFEVAIPMLRRLADTAASNGRGFGVKLTNTLEVENHREVFAASERRMYLSGAALYPLTLALARDVTEALDRRVRVSFSGGADAHRFADLVMDGLWPVTVCTDLLKPGGYGRLPQYLENLAWRMREEGADSIEALSALGRDHLARHVAQVLGGRDHRLMGRPRPLAWKGTRQLGAFDCIAAPCQEGCPANQDIPRYLWLAANGRTAESLEVILETNAMPAVTGSVCDRPCTERCVRVHYDAPIAIREVKRHTTMSGVHGRKVRSRDATHERRNDGTTEQGMANATVLGPAPGAPCARIAIVGAGPAGLSAARYLAEAGLSVTLFEARPGAGGMVSTAIPDYRLGRDALEEDIERVRLSGVEIRFGLRLGRDFSLDDLRSEGFCEVVLAMGAEAGKELAIPGENSAGVLDALEFLECVKAGRAVSKAHDIIVVGGGNTAMDAARTARRVFPEGRVTLVYRRTRAEMPADLEEVDACAREGIAILELLAPVRVEETDGRAGRLVLQAMRLGARDSSGRRRPIPIDGTSRILEADLILSAIGQAPSRDATDIAELARNPDGTIRVDPTTFESSEPGLFAGGDLVRGASSVIQAVADGRAIASEIARRHGVELASRPVPKKHHPKEELLLLRARTEAPVETIADVTADAARCLQCDELCSLCATVCPNRANQAYELEPFAIDLPVLVAESGQLLVERTRRFAVEQSVQIANIGDFCNDCGNCTTFCPTAGAPFRDKPRFWLDREAFEATSRDAFHMSRAEEGVRIDARFGSERVALTQSAGRAEYRSASLTARFVCAPERGPGSWTLAEVVPATVPKDGERFDLFVSGILLALLPAEAVLPMAPGPRLPPWL